MEIIHGIYSLKPEHKGCVLTIGNFDGVHHGHRMLLDHLFAKSKELGVPSMLLTFEPQPREHFAPHEAPARLTRLREKLSALAALPLDRVTRRTTADLGYPVEAKSITARILPRPRVRLHEVEIARSISVEHAEIELRLLPLLRGNFEGGDASLRVAPPVPGEAWLLVSDLGDGVSVLVAADEWGHLALPRCGRFEVAWRVDLPGREPLEFALPSLPVTGPVELPTVR